MVQGFLFDMTNRNKTLLFLIKVSYHIILSHLCHADMIYKQNRVSPFSKEERHTAKLLLWEKSLLFA